MNVGDRVMLVAPDWPCSGGGLVFSGQKGMVVGHKGFQLVVSWDDPNGSEGPRNSDIDEGSVMKLR